MAHFIGYVQGARGEASRLGSKSSGIDATGRGWNIGGSVMLRSNESKDEEGKKIERDSVTLSVDSGSNHRGDSYEVACFEEGENGERVLKHLNRFSLTHIGEDYCKVERYESGEVVEYELPLIVAEIFKFSRK